MSALIPPRHDLRGGKASANSFAIPNIAFVALMDCSLAAVESHELAYLCDNLIHELSPAPFPLAIWCGFLGNFDIVNIVFDM